MATLESRLIELIQAIGLDIKNLTNDKVNVADTKRVVVYDDQTTPSTAGQPVGTVFFGYDVDG